MSTTSAHERHRAHHTKVWRAAALVVLLAQASCSGSLPRPRRVQVSADDYVAVPYPPRAPPVEVVPPRPSGDAVWVDGSWRWSGRRYLWKRGAWVEAPEGARYARWVVVRRKGDGQLFFAPSSWRDAAGRALPDPPPLREALSRPGVDVVDVEDGRPPTRGGAAGSGR